MFTIFVTTQVFSSDKVAKYCTANDWVETDVRRMMRGLFLREFQQSKERITVVLAGGLDNGMQIGI